MRARYLLAAVALFLVELTIALRVHDNFVRPFLGDTLVVVLLYCASQAIFPQSYKRSALEVLLLAYAVEAGQAADFAAWLGADRIPWLSVLLGRTFSWADLAAYTVGYAIVIFTERYIFQRET